MKVRKRFTLLSEQVDDVEEKDWKEVFRASGEMCCICGQKLKEHYQPMQKTCPTIVEDCTGKWWKL